MECNVCGLGGELHEFDDAFPGEPMHLECAETLPSNPKHRGDCATCEGKGRMIEPAISEAPPMGEPPNQN
jgi:hypothetical protein